MNHLAGIQNMVGQVTAALGLTVNIARKEPSGDSAQDAYSVGSGNMATSNGGNFDVVALPGKADIAAVPSSLMDKELQMYTVAIADCDFGPARGMWLTPASGALSGVALPILYVDRRAGDAAINIYTQVRSRSAGLPSSGEDL